MESFVTYCESSEQKVLQRTEFDGTIKYTFADGTLHREDGPAVIHPDGDKYWYQYGKLHRDDGPAIEYSNGAEVGS